MALARKATSQRQPSTRADSTIEQDYGAYSAAEHGIWGTLFERQQRLRPHRLYATNPARITLLYRQQATK